MRRQTHTLETATLILALAGTLLSPHVARGADQEKRPGLTGITISFKLDPRLIDTTYGGERWVSPRTFTGANAQDTVEARAQGVDGKGTPTKVSPEWTPSDPEMVTVSPSQGDRVKIIVHRAGESTLKVAAQGLSKELVVKAKYLGKAIQVEIAQPAPGKSDRAATAPNTSVFKSEKERLSYAVGMDLADTLRKQSVEVDAGLVIQGFEDAHSGSKTLMTEEQVQATVIGVQTELRNAQLKLLAERNKKEGEAFLAANKAKEGVVTLESGLQYKILKAGDGKKPTLDSTVVCRYRGTLVDGTQFDKRTTPVSFPLKLAVKGWREAFQLMPAGSVWRLFIPADLGYGERGAPRSHIGPNATLIFEVELLAIEGPAGAGEQKAADTARARTEDN